MEHNHIEIVDVVTEHGDDAIYTTLARLGGPGSDHYVDVAGNVLIKNLGGTKLESKHPLSIEVFDRQLNRYTIADQADKTEFSKRPSVKETMGALQRALLERDGTFRPNYEDGTEIFEEGEMSHLEFRQKFLPNEGIEQILSYKTPQQIGSFRTMKTGNVDSDDRK